MATEGVVRNAESPRYAGQRLSGNDGCIDILPLRMCANSTNPRHENTPIAAGPRRLQNGYNRPPNGLCAQKKSLELLRNRVGKGRIELPIILPSIKEPAFLRTIGSRHLSLRSV